MARRRIFSVILAVLLVICCVTEALFIKNLQNDRSKMQEQMSEINGEMGDLQAELERMAERVEEKADIPSVRLYLPDDLYICDANGADIYNSSVVYGINLNSYAFYWESEIGNSRHDRFEIPASENTAGDYDVTLHVYDLGLNEVAAKTTRLHILKDSFEESMDELHPFILSENPNEISEELAECEAAEEEDANVIVIYPSAYEVYADLDATMDNITKLVADTKKQHKSVPILIVEPAYPGSTVEEEATVEEDAENTVQKWAYAEKTMVFRLVSDLEKTYIEDDLVKVVPNALTTNSEYSPEKVGDTICGMICQLIATKEIVIDKELDESAEAKDE